MVLKNKNPDPTPVFFIPPPPQFGLPPGILGGRNLCTDPLNGSSALCNSAKIKSGPPRRPQNIN